MLRKSVRLTPTERISKTLAHRLLLAVSPGQTRRSPIKLCTALEALIEPGDRVTIEGDNQKQADLAAAAFAKADPAREPLCADGITRSLRGLERMDWLGQTEFPAWNRASIPRHQDYPFPRMIKGRGT